MLVEEEHKKAYAMHGVLDILYVMEADCPMHDSLWTILHPFRSDERCGGVPEEKCRCSEEQDINESVPREDEEGPQQEEDRENANGARPGRRRAGEPSREIGEGIGVRGLASAGEEEGHEGGSVAEGVVEAEDGDGGGIGDGEVEDVELPQGAGGVHRGGGEGSHVVLHRLIRRPGDAARVEVWEHDVVLHRHLGGHPSWLLAAAFLKHLQL